jgi:hypothetical protein
MHLPKRVIRPSLFAGVVLLLMAATVLGEPGRRVPNRRPTMPPKPPILNIPNGGRQAAFQPGHGAFGNVQSSALGQAGQAGQAGQGGIGGAAGGGAGAFGGGGFAAFGQFGMGQFGNQGIGGGLFGGGLFGGFGGGFKGFSVGGNLLGPEPQYRNGVGLFGGASALSGAVPETELPRSELDSVSGYHQLLLHPVVVDSAKSR